MRQTKKLRRPIVMYNVTEDCQLRCKHCYNESGGRKSCTPSRDKLFEDIEKISKVAGAINFTGGEPFLVPDLPYLMTLAYSNGADTIVTTNGLCFMKKDASELLEKIEEPTYMMKIGMMGATPETNDYIRGRGHFEVAVKSLDLLANYDFVSCIKVSLDKHNMNEIEDFVRLALDHNVDQIVFGQLVQVGRASKFLRNLMPSLDNTKRISDEIKRVKEKYWGSVKIAQHCTLSGLCLDHGHFYTVTVRGGMTPCLMREDLAIGNIRTDDVNLLFSEVDNLRKDVKTHSSVRDIINIEKQEGLKELVLQNA